MALLPSLAAGWLPPVLAGFRQAYPGIVLEVADVLSEACLDRVRGGSADFALAATRPDTSELRTELFCADRFHLVCRRDHPLARKRELRLKDLASEPFVEMSRGSSVRQYLDAAIHPLQMNGVLEVEQLATVMGMVRAWAGHQRGPGAHAVPLPQRRHRHAAAARAGAETPDLPRAKARSRVVDRRAGPVRVGDGAPAERGRAAPPSR